jgi:hypothetical protein
LALQSLRINILLDLHRNGSAICLSLECFRPTDIHCTNKLPFDFVQMELVLAQPQPGFGAQSQPGFGAQPQPGFGAPAANLFGVNIL